MKEEKWNSELEERLGHLDVLSNIADELGINPKRLYRWAEPGRKNSFPSVKKTLGKYNLYDKNEVIEWVYLWTKISKNLGNKNLPTSGRKHNG